MADNEMICVECDGVPVRIDPGVVEANDLLEARGALPAALGDMPQAPTRLPKAMRILLGDEQYEAVKASLREGGRTSATRMAAFFREVVEKAGEKAKN